MVIDSGVSRFLPHDRSKIRVFLYLSIGLYNRQAWATAQPVMNSSVIVAFCVVILAVYGVRRVCVGLFFNFHFSVAIAYKIVIFDKYELNR